MTTPELKLSLKPLQWKASSYFEIEMAYCPVFQCHYYAETPGDKERVEKRRADRILAAFDLPPNLDDLLAAARLAGYNQAKEEAYQADLRILEGDGSPPIPGILEPEENPTVLTFHSRRKKP
jgi:hypothetical protein